MKTIILITSILYYSLKWKKNKELFVVFSVLSDKNVDRFVITAFFRAKKKLSGFLKTPVASLFEL